MAENRITLGELAVAEKSNEITAVPELLDLIDVKLWFDNETPSKSVTTRDKGHGRIETREYFLESDVGRLSQKLMWSGLAAIGASRSAVVENDVKRVFT